MMDTLNSSILAKIQIQRKTQRGGDEKLGGEDKVLSLSESSVKCQQSRHPAV